MLLLLPPSEGKAVPRRGRPLDLDALAHPELAETRSAVLDALIALCREDPAGAVELLGLGARGADEVARNAALREQPTAAASRIYTGVLYDHLDVEGLPAGAKRRAGRRVLVFSALWGVLRLADRIPSYRLSAGARLPGLATPAAVWAPVLRQALPADELCVDLRSGSYRSLWRPEHAPLVGIDVVREQAGRRTVVSHMAKATRGAVARALLVDDARPPRTAEAVAARVEAAGWTVELGDADRAGRSTLTVVERD